MKFGKVFSEKYDEYTTVYFDLIEDDEEYSDNNEPNGDERKAYKEAQRMLSKFGSHFSDEGHDQYGKLVCKFTVKKTDIPKLQKFIKRTHGGGDDIIYLDEPGFVIQSFHITDNPGLDAGLYFDDWDDYNIKESSNNLTVPEQHQKILHSKHSK